MRDDTFLKRVNHDRISSRQVDELIGLAHGLLADGVINHPEAEFLQKWLAANTDLSDQPLIHTLYDRVNEMLSDGCLCAAEQEELFEVLHDLTGKDFELGEILKSSNLPLCKPQPDLDFVGRRYTFTGTFLFGQRKDCEKAVIDRGAEAGSLTQATSFLVVGVYATESWKHSSMGNKILKAAEMRDRGVPISIISEAHWREYL
ncbi:MAG: BRCT domain-containing protein [Novosphingobium sp.]|nr:BRCT domain-containing protein [Novosphingobium sp.]MCP5388677.1 BRCT domain-containing protein [Novosphingobium sp.]